MAPKRAKPAAPATPPKRRRVKGAPAEEAEAPSATEVDAGAQEAGGKPQSKAKAKPRAKSEKTKQQNNMLTAIQAAAKSQVTETRESAEQAMEHWKMVQGDWKAKESMVASYADARKKGKNMVRWVHDFKESRSKIDETTATIRQDWSSGGQVLNHLGIPWEYFPTYGNAFVFIEEEVRKNQEKSKTLEECPPQIDDENPLNNRYYYTFSSGKQRPRAGRNARASMHQHKQHHDTFPDSVRSAPPAGHWGASWSRSTQRRLRILKT